MHSTTITTSTVIAHRFQPGDVIVLRDDIQATIVVRSFYGGNQRFVVSRIEILEGDPSYHLTRLTEPVENDHARAFYDTIEFIDSQFVRVLS